MICITGFFGINHPRDVADSSAAKKRHWPPLLLWGLVRALLPSSSEEPMFSGTSVCGSGCGTWWLTQPTSASRELCRWQPVLTELKGKHRRIKQRHTQPTWTKKKKRKERKATLSNILALVQSTKEKKSKGRKKSASLEEMKMHPF